MGTRKISGRFFRAHTVSGPLTGGTMDELERKIASKAAYDAVRYGQGDERPWLVDESGKPTRPMKRYVEYLTSESIYDHNELSPPHRQQNSSLRDLVEKLEILGEELDNTLRESEVIDPVARALLRREAKKLAVSLLRRLDGTEHLAKEIEDLP